MFCHNRDSLGRKSLENFNASVYTDGALQSSLGAYQQYLRSVYCLEFTTDVHMHYQTFSTCKHRMLGTFKRQKNLVAPRVLVVTLTTSTSSVLWVSECARPSVHAALLQSRPSPWPCTHVCQPYSEDVQGGPDIENSSLIIISFNCLFFFVGLFIV